MDLLVYDYEGRRYVPAVAALCGAAILAAVIAVLAYFLVPNQPVRPISGVTALQAAGVEQSTCVPALKRADAALALGDQLEQSLAEQTSLVDELLAQRATAEQVLDQALPPLTKIAKDRQGFLDAVTVCQQARVDCQQ